MITRLTTIRELAFLACTTMESAGIEAVLVGGAAAHIYAPEAYVSHDLDFVLGFWSEDREARAALESLGFEREGRNMRHGNCPLTIEFPAGPLAVGEELIRTWETLREGGQILHILHPTDSVKDRLAGYLFWNDRQSLSTAAAVAQVQGERVDLQKVRRWCEKEGGAERFQDFVRALRRLDVEPTL